MRIFPSWVALVSLISLRAESVPDAAQVRTFIDSLPGELLKVKPTRTKTGEYVLVASQDISPRDKVATLPIQYAITTFDGFPLSKAFSDASEEVKIVARLVYERFYGKNDTFAKRWVDTFPGFGRNLFLWNDAETASLRAYDLYGLWNDQINLTTAFLDYASRLESVSQPYPEMKALPAFLWGFSQYIRRCFSIAKSYWKLGKKYPVLSGDADIDGIGCYPLIDLAGYCTIKRPFYDNSLGVVTENETVSIVLKSEFYLNRTQRFCLSYGRYNSFELLMYYGVALSYNPFDHFYVVLPKDSRFPCIGEDLGNQCKFRLEPQWLSDPLLTFIRVLKSKKSLPQLSSTELAAHYFALNRTSDETQVSYFSSLKKYRGVVKTKVIASVPYSVRNERRKTLSNTTETDQMTHTFAVSVLTGPYNHLAKIERILLQVIVTSLKI